MECHERKRLFIVIKNVSHQMHFFVLETSSLQNRLGNYFAAGNNNCDCSNLIIEWWYRLWHFYSSKGSC